MVHATYEGGRLTLYKTFSPSPLHHLQNKTVYEIASELNRLHSLGLAGQLTPADIVGGTFSLSNIGAVS